MKNITEDLYLELLERNKSVSRESLAKEFSLPIKKVRKILGPSNKRLSEEAWREILFQLDELSMSQLAENKNNPIKDYRGRKCYDLKYGSKKDLPLFYDFIYSNSSVYLSRKYNIFSSMFSQ